MFSLEKYLAGHSMFSIEPGLTTTGKLCALTGHPERSLRFIHVAGTNGKGSTCAMTERALRTAGFKTGFYSSPHLVRIHERFKINGRTVSDKVLNAAAEEMARQIGDTHCSYFEFVTVLAMKIFAAAKVDAVIWECGMGGRLDATNVVTPLASVITNIALDHQKYLGDTVEKIAAEKAGIIKPGVPVFAGVMPEAARRVIEKKAREQHAPFRFIPPGTDEPVSLKIGKRAVMQIFEHHGFPVQLPLPGAMQRRNFYLVFQILQYLAETLHFDLAGALKGIAKVRWAGRCQYLNERLLIDGGHNPDGLTALAEALKELYPGEKQNFVFGAFRDKEVLPSLQILAPLAKKFYFTPLSAQDRPSRDPAELKKELHQLSPGIPAETFADAGSALAAAETDASARCVVCGSLFLIGEILKKKGKRL